MQNLWKRYVFLVFFLCFDDYKAINEFDESQICEVLINKKKEVP